MRIYTVVFALLLLASPLARAESVEMEQAGIISSDQTEIRDRTKEYACDCCQKCKAARRPVAPKEEGGAVESNGCKDCCARCGKELQPAPGEAPPEVIEKRIPPEMLDKPKR